jgi:GNAT superfamily N-acetyltransferase
LRPARPEDDPFLREVYAETRAEELNHAGLDADQRQAFIDMQFNAQKADYLRRFPKADYDVVEYESQPIGRLYVAGSDDEVRILDVTLVSSSRNRGIGTHLLRRLLSEAREEKLPVRIYVENASRSVRLFESLGFSCTDRQSLVSLFEWRPDERELA